MKKLYLLMFAMLLASVSVFNSCKPKDPDDISESEFTIETNVITSSVTDITTESAKCGGEVRCYYDDDIYERGICWSTSSQPDVNDQCATSGVGSGSFTCEMTGLEDNTTYYVRAYAKMYDYVVYGEQKSFTTEKYETIVNTSSVTDITTNSAICGGNIMSDEAENIVERGICWSTSSQPDVNDQCATSGVGSGSFTCEMTGLEDNTTYYVRAYAKMYDYVVYGEQRSFKTEEDDEVCDPDGEIAGHGYVDLGLPSGLKWATCNVGASSPEDYGDYFAWGETSPKAEYTWENSVTLGEQMSDISGNAQYDAATANWGGSWRMPTGEQMEELVEHCEWEWTQVNGVNGAKVIGPNGSCVFLPAAGYRDGSSLFNAGYGGSCWSSAPGGYYDDSYAYNLIFYFGYEYVNSYYRSIGRTVRPITE